MLNQRQLIRLVDLKIEEAKIEMLIMIRPYAASSVEEGLLEIKAEIEKLTYKLDRA